MTLRSARAVVAASGAGDDRADVIAIDGALVLVVADGAGGTGGGAQAAEAVIAGVRARVEPLVTGALDAMTLLEELDLSIARTGGETTAVIVVATAGGLSGASVGDSRAWVVEERAIVALTRYQQRKPLLGSGAAIVTPFAAPALRGTLVLGTDGLFQYAPRDGIAQIARTVALSDAPGPLIALARLRGGGLQDDVAVIVAREVEE